MQGYITNHISRIPELSQEEIDRQRQGSATRTAEIEHNSDINHAAQDVRNQVYDLNSLHRELEEEQRQYLRVDTAKQFSDIPHVTD